MQPNRGKVASRMDAAKDDGDALTPSMSRRCVRECDGWDECSDMVWCGEMCEHCDVKRAMVQRSTGFGLRGLALTVSCLLRRRVSLARRPQLRLTVTTGSLLSVAGLCQ